MLHREAAGRENRKPLRVSIQQMLVALALVAALGLLGVVGYAMVRQQGRLAGVGSVNSIGQLGRVAPGPAPDFELKLFDSGSFRLGEKRGQVVLLNFWASWCLPCREEAPVLTRAWQRHQAGGLAMVGLNIWDTERDARAFLREFGVTYPNGPDPQAASALRYGVSGIPETFLVGRDGTIYRHWVGPLTDAQVEALISAAMLPSSP